MRCLILCLLVFSSVVFSGPVYKCVDEEGVTHYSNSPVCGDKGAAEHIAVKENYSANDSDYTADDVNRHYLNKWSEEERQVRAAKQAQLERERRAYEERKARRRAKRFNCTTTHSGSQSYTNCQ